MKYSILNIKKKKKPSILGVLITFDISIIAAIFIILLIFFNSSIAELLSDTAADSMRARSGQIAAELKEAYAYIASKDGIDTVDIPRAVNENVIGHALNELEYDGSLAVLVFSDTEITGGTRTDRNSISEAGGFTQLTDADGGSGRQSLSELKEYLPGVEGNTLLVRFRYNRIDYIGTAQLTGGPDAMLILADRTDDFFHRLYRIRNMFLLLIGTVLVLVLIVKIMNTRAVAGEIFDIRTQLQMQGDAIQNDGIIRNTAEPDEFEFMDTNDLAGSFYYLNSRIENLGEIIEGIADKDLFRAALRDDESVLTPHEEEMAILFLDVQGFTGISEQFGSGAMNIINRIWDMVQAAVEKNNGKLNKFMGDACLVIFPQTDATDAPASLGAVKSAAELYKIAPKLREELETDFSFRIGLDYGPVVYGRTGSERKYELGVIGDPVNTAARFESLNKQYGTKLLLSGEIIENAGFSSEDDALTPVLDDLFLFRVDKARPKGKKNPKVMYSLLVPDKNKKNEFSLIGLNRGYHYKLLKMHNVFLDAYEKNIAFWRDGKINTGRNVWSRLAYSWAIMYRKYGFSIAGIFVERFVSAENYLSYVKDPQNWIENRRIVVKPPDKSWVETGYYELEK